MTYSIWIAPSNEGFIAVIPELAGCSAFGETEEEALSEVKVAIGLWLDTARREGREIPAPGGREHLQEILAGKGDRPRGKWCDLGYYLTISILDVSNNHSYTWPVLT